MLDKRTEPLRLVDREDGKVALRLFPFFLERLHGAREDSALLHEPGLPFPLMLPEKPVEVEVTGGMGRVELLAMVGVEPTSSNPNVPGLSIGAYAWTCFGWADPQFWFR